MEVSDTVQEAVINTIPKKNKCKKANWLRRPYKELRKKREAKGKAQK